MGNSIQSTFSRYEKKYMLTSEQLSAIQAGIEKQMTADTYGQYTISNIYYDTEDYRLIRTSLEKPVYKEKLRMRSYGVPSGSDPVFVELKKKYNGVVYKRRVVLSADCAVDYIDHGILPPDENQICHEIDWFMRFWKPVPKVFIAYDRTAFAGREDPELRITFDRNLRWRDTELDLRAGTHGALFLPEDQTLMEIKIPGTAPVWLAHLLSENGVFPVSFSKYGTCYIKNILPQFPGSRNPAASREVFPCA